MTGKQLKRIRRSLGMTQQELASCLWVTSATLCRWERGVLPITKSMALLVTLFAKQWRKQRIQNVVND